MNKHIKSAALFTWDVLTVLFEIMWTCFCIVLFVYVTVVLTGCSEPSTMAEHQFNQERMMRACRNVGGVWYHPEGRIYAGRCDWNRSVF